MQGQGRVVGGYRRLNIVEVGACGAGNNEDNLVFVVLVQDGEQQHPVVLEVDFILDVIINDVTAHLLENTLTDCDRITRLNYNIVSCCLSLGCFLPLKLYFLT